MLNTFSGLWLVSFYLFAVSFVSKKLATLCSVPFIVFCFSLAALRADKFPDYIEYVGIFRDVSNSALLSADFLSVHGEFGFKLICKLLSVFFDSSLSVMIFFSFLSCFLLLKICFSNGLSLPAVWLIYFSNAYLLKDLAQIRNSVASLLVVEGVLLLAKNGHRFNANLKFMCAGFFFQYLAVSALLIGFFRSRVVLIMSFFISVALFFVLNFEMLQIIFGDYGYFSQYAGTIYVDADYYNPWSAIIRVALFIVIVSWFSRGVCDSAVDVMKLALCISFFCYVSFAGIPILSQRLGGYFFAIDAFICAALLRSSKRVEVSIFIAIYAFLIFTFNLVGRDFLGEGYESLY